MICRRLKLTTMTKKNNCVSCHLEIKKKKTDEVGRFLRIFFVCSGTAKMWELLFKTRTNIFKRCACKVISQIMVLSGQK